MEETPEGFTVNVEVPYLIYERYENVYQDSVKDGQKILIVEKRKLTPPYRTDIYLESLIRSEILAGATGSK